MRWRSGRVRVKTEKLKVGRATLGEEREGSRVADISINAAWGGVQRGKTTTSQRHLAAHGLCSAMGETGWALMGWELGDETRARAKGRASFPGGCVSTVQFSVALE